MAYHLVDKLTHSNHDDDPFMNEKQANNPIERFKDLLHQAEQLGLPNPNAAAFASAGNDHQPSVRMLLLKEVDQRGFVFYTNLDSHKALQLRDNPRASACFYWAPIERQVRIEGLTELVSHKEADTYFATRPRGSQIGAWASPQSRELASRGQLLESVAAFEAKFANESVPRPPRWSGYRLVPERIEFWKGQPDRLHERELYLRAGDSWRVKLLAP